MNNPSQPDDAPPLASAHGPDWPDDVLRRLGILERNQRDILFLLRLLRPALAFPRVEISADTRHIHCQVLRLPPFDGRCPCCLDTPVVATNATVIPPAEFDHFLGPVFSAPVHTWLICRDCHHALSNDRHLLWYDRLVHRFRSYQAAVAAQTPLIGGRTPARMSPRPRVF